MKDDFFAGFFIFTLFFFLAAVGLTHLFGDCVPPTEVLSSCKVRGYYQYQQDRIQCKVEEIK